MVVFGGELWPLGNGVAFVELPLADAIAAYREGLNPPPTLAHLGVLPIIDLMATLLPLQMPYKRRLLVGTTSNWTTIFDNSRGGGDPYSHARLATAHGVRAVAARHAPETQTALPATQFHLLGPTGEPPLMYVRTIDAGRFDSGRWEFLTSGTPQPFEDTTRTSAAESATDSHARCFSTISGRSASEPTIPTSIQRVCSPPTPETGHPVGGAHSTMSEPSDGSDLHCCISPPSPILR